MPRLLLSTLLCASAAAMAAPAAFAQSQVDPFANQPEAYGAYADAPLSRPSPSAPPAQQRGRNGYDSYRYDNGNQPYGRVIAVNPSYQQVNVPQQVCNDQQVYTGQRNSGVGALTGAVIGGVLGHGVGRGFGRAAATGVGVVAGSAIGNQIEGGYPSYQTVRQCGTQYVLQQQQTGYTVDYEYAGQRFSTQTQSDPGEWIALSVQPLASNNPPDRYDDQAYAPAPFAGVGPGYASPEPGMVVGAPGPIMAPAPVYVRPAVAVQPVIQIGVGGYWGGRGHWR